MISIPGVYLYKVPNTFENFNEFRLAIRESIYKNLTQNLNLNPLKSEILNLNQTPKLTDCGLSISHTKHFGAYVLSLSELHIGLDIEDIQRVKKEHLLRVSTVSEVQRAPTLAHLWTAKEAAFKSLYKLKPVKVLAQIEISNWKILSENHFAFSFFFNDSRELRKEGRGSSWEEKCLNMSFCTISP